MTFYCTTADCLRQYILKYFGERSANFCGNCSNCNTNFETVDITVEAQKIISCVYRVAQKQKSFGKNMIADILHGSKNEKIRRFRLDDLSTYGIMAEVPARRVRSMMDFLIENGCLFLTNDEYPVVKLTERSAEVIRNKEQVLMKLPKEQQPDKPQINSVLSTIDKGLMTELKSLRKEFAAEAHVPAFVVFADAALRDMCQKLPQTKEEFLQVSGVGTAKKEKYGDKFTGLIRSYLAEHPELQKSQENAAACPVKPDLETSYREKVINRGLHCAYSSWTSEEDAQLEEEYKSGLTIREISGIHKRTGGAIISRLKKLGLKE